MGSTVSYGFIYLLASLIPSSRFQLGCLLGFLNKLLTPHSILFFLCLLAKESLSVVCFSTHVPARKAGFYNVGRS